MKPASNAPVYAALYAEFAEVFRRHGYALAIHGSLVRDFDVVAVPWVEVPSKPEDVIDELCRTFAVENVSGPEKKLHGRLAWTIAIGFGESRLDLSFVPVARDVGRVLSTLLSLRALGVYGRDGTVAERLLDSAIKELLS